MKFMTSASVRNLPGYLQEDRATEQMNRLQKEKDEEKAQKALVAEMSYAMYEAINNNPDKTPDEVMAGVLPQFKGNPALTPEGVQAAATIAIQQTAKTQNDYKFKTQQENDKAAAAIIADETATRNALNATTPGSTFKAQTALEKLASDKDERENKNKKLGIEKQTADSTVLYQDRLGSAALQNAATAAKRAEDMMALAELRNQGKGAGKEPQALNQYETEQLTKAAEARLAASGAIRKDMQTGVTTIVLPTDGQGKLVDESLTDDLNRLGTRVYPKGNIVGTGKNFTREFTLSGIDPQYRKQFINNNEDAAPTKPAELARHNKVFMDGFIKDGNLNPEDPRLKVLSDEAEKSSDVKIKEIAAKVFSGAALTNAEVDVVRNLTKNANLPEKLNALTPGSNTAPGTPVVNPEVPAAPVVPQVQQSSGILDALKSRFPGLSEPVQAAPLTPMAGAIKDAAIKDAAVNAVTPAPAGAAEMPQAPQQDYTSALSLLEKGLPGAIVKSNKSATLDKLAPNSVSTDNQGVPPEVVALIKVGQEVAASNPAAAEQIKALLAKVTSGEPLSEQEQKLIQLVLQRANK